MLSNRKLGLFLLGFLNFEHVYNYHLLDALSGSQASVRPSYACHNVCTRPYRAQLSDGKLKSTLEKDFGSIEDFKKAFNAKAAALQGSGWCWLVRISWSMSGKC